MPADAAAQDAGVALPESAQNDAGAPEATAEQRLSAANASDLLGGNTRAPAAFSLGGYAEIFYQWNFNAPSNGITNYRGFDNRHNTFTISNVAIDAQWDYENVVGRVTLQVGHTASTYYANEPSATGAGGASSTGAEVWKYIQQAYGGYRFNIGNGLLVTGGIFLSPIGPEGMAVRDNWNWSRSNSFFGLPFYHTGLRITYPVSDRWAVTLAGYNGWNSVVDNNDEKSLSMQATYTLPNTLALSVLYFGGVERNSGAPEGRAWRHDLDVHATWQATPWLQLLGHANAGIEPNKYGMSAWFTSALYARFKLLPQLFVTARGDVFYEHVPSNDEGTASPIIWPVSWVSSATLTFEYKPHDRVSFRLEARHDHAADNIYFGGDVAGDGSPTMPYVPNRASQNTVVLGATTWF